MKRGCTYAKVVGEDIGPVDACADAGRGPDGRKSAGEFQRKLYINMRLAISLTI